MSEIFLNLSIYLFILIDIFIFLIFFLIIFHYFSLPPHIWVCVRVRFPEVLLPLISHYFVADIFVMDGIFVFLRSYLSLSSLDFYIGWFVHLPEVLFPLLSHCFPIFMFVLDIIFIFLRS